MKPLLCPMRLRFFILLLILFSGYDLSSFGEKTVADIAVQYAGNPQRYADNIRAGAEEENEVSGNTQNNHEALLLRQNNNPHTAPAAKARYSGFDIITVNNSFSFREIFPTIISFHAYTTLLADFKNALLFPKHFFW